MSKKRISYVQETCNENIFKPTWLSVKIFRNQNIYSHDFKLVKAMSFAVMIEVQVMLVFTLVSFRVKTGQLFLNKSIQLCKRETLFLACFISSSDISIRFFLNAATLFRLKFISSSLADSESCSNFWQHSCW